MGRKEEVVGALGRPDSSVKVSMLHALLCREHTCARSRDTEVLTVQAGTWDSQKKCLLPKTEKTSTLTSHCLVQEGRQTRDTGRGATDLATSVLMPPAPVLSPSLSATTRLVTGAASYQAAAPQPAATPPALSTTYTAAGGSLQNDICSM